MLGRKKQMLLEVSRDAKRTLLVGTVLLVFQSIFKESGIVTFLSIELSAPLEV